MGFPASSGRSSNHIGRCLYAPLGIGRQVAISFAAEGCRKIAICDQNAKGLAETRSLIIAKWKDVEVETRVLDVSDEKSVVDMTARVVDVFKRIDYTVNCAGRSSTLLLFAVMA